MKNEPLVTIITATYNLVEQNRVKTFLQTVKSVQDQTYKNIEHLIIDGGSKDGTIDIIKFTGLKYISEPDNGIYDAFNKAIKLASGKYINFLNSDDFFNNINAVKESVELLEKTNSDYSFATEEFLKDDGYPCFYFYPKMKTKYSKFPFGHQTMFTKTDVIKKEGLFDLTFKSASDYDLMIRLFLKGYKYCQVKDILTSFRLGGESDTNVELSIKEQVAIFKKNYSKYANLSDAQYEDILIKNYLPLKLLFKLPKLGLLSYLFYINKILKNIIKFRLNLFKGFSYICIGGKCIYGKYNRLNLENFISRGTRSSTNPCARRERERESN